jgi:hypothetical protein
MSSASTTRRAVLAGAASLPALAVAPAVAIAGDPIFLAIDRHRRTFMQTLFDIEPSMQMYGSDPDYEKAAAAAAAAWDRTHAAAVDLIKVQPTTLAGVIALLKYVEEFNSGALQHPELEGSYSELALWQDYELADENGDVLDQPFAYWVMWNVRRALEALSAAGKAVNS